jgi:hypothetical protein
VSDAETSARIARMLARFDDAHGATEDESAPVTV